MIFAADFTPNFFPTKKKTGQMLLLEDIPITNIATVQENTENTPPSSPRLPCRKGGRAHMGGGNNIFITNVPSKYSLWFRAVCNTARNNERQRKLAEKRPPKRCASTAKLFP